jgi:hypothetical protein
LDDGICGLKYTQTPNIYTREINDEKRCDGVCVSFKPQIMRIVRANILFVTGSGCLLHQARRKQVKSPPRWALYTFCSIESNAALVFESIEETV